MPIPQNHKNQLGSMDKLAKLVNDPQFQNVLDLLFDSNDEREKAKNDARNYLINKGVNLPAGATVTLRNNNWSIEVCVGSYCLKYDSNSGYSMNK